MNLGDTSILHPLFFLNEVYEEDGAIVFREACKLGL